MRSLVIVFLYKKNKKVIFSLILLIGVFFIISDNKIGILNNKNNYNNIVIKQQEFMRNFYTRKKKMNCTKTRIFRLWILYYYVNIQTARYLVQCICRKDNSVADSSLSNIFCHFRFLVPNVGALPGPVVSGPGSTGSKTWLYRTAILSS